MVEFVNILTERYKPEQMMRLECEEKSSNLIYELRKNSDKLVRIVPKSYRKSKSNN
jgi:hypothetical protein